TGAGTPGGARTYRGWSGATVSVLAAAVAVFLLVDVVVRGGGVQLLLLAPWVLLGLWVVYEASAASFFRVDDDGVLVQNLLRRTAFGWNRVRDVDYVWQVQFSLDDGRTVAAMGGPARSRPRRQTARERDVEGPRVPAGITALAELEERRHAAAGPAADAPIHRTWDWPALAALLVIAVWAVVAVLVTR
ncbi:MAG: PH domain-containing protein, partial [Microbacterium sp.]